MIQIDYTAFTEMIPPQFKRTTHRLDWLTLFSDETKNDYDKFTLDFTDFEYTSKHNYQIMVLEHFLNELGAVNTITITDGEWLPQPFTFMESGKASPQQDYLFLEGTSGVAADDQIYEFSDAYYETDQIDFVVNVSTVDTDLEAKIKYWIDYYKIAGSTYRIDYY